MWSNYGGWNSAQNKCSYNYMKFYHFYFCNIICFPLIKKKTICFPKTFSQTSNSPNPHSWSLMLLQLPITKHTFI